MSEPSFTLTEITIYNLSVRIRTKDYLIYNELKKFLNRYYTVYQNSFNTSDKEVKPYYFFSHEEFFSWNHALIEKGLRLQSTAYLRKT